jgi:hypothetical protein
MNFKEYQNDKLSIHEMKNAKGGAVTATLGRNDVWTGPITDLGRRDDDAEAESSTETTE